jgi:ABC-type transport system involved in cytochrome bd biosynthesis fused ATPase/permease subunit
MVAESELPVDAVSRLRTVKLFHTLIWALFAGCIVAIPVAAVLGWFKTALALALIVMVEVMILVLNRLRCPLTAVAAKYTDDRRPNFDIYLPEWLAHYNKAIFGTLYLVGCALAVVLWLIS